MANDGWRKNRLVILLHDDERERLDTWANTRHLPTSTLARQVLLDCAAHSAPRLVDPAVEYETEEA